MTKTRTQMMVVSSVYTGYCARGGNSRSASSRPCSMYAITSLTSWVQARRWGFCSDPASAPWGRCDGQLLMRALGFTRAQPPGAAAVYHGLRQRHSPLVEASLGVWAESIRTALPPAPGEREAMASAGATRRGSRQPGAGGVP
jgi:hypothetical protein